MEQSVAYIVTSDPSFMYSKNMKGVHIGCIKVLVFIDPPPVLGEIIEGFDHVLLIIGPKSYRNLEGLRAESPKIKILQKEVIQIGCVGFIGCSLWTCVPSPIRDHGGANEEYAHKLMDELGLTEDELNAEHYDHLIWLCQAIQDNPNHQVLTYTPPTGINNLERLKIHTAGWYSMEKLFSA